MPSLEVGHRRRLIGTLEVDLDVADVVVGRRVPRNGWHQHRLNRVPANDPAIVAVKRKACILGQDLYLHVNPVEVDPLRPPVEAIGDGLAIEYLLDIVSGHDGPLIGRASRAENVVCASIAQQLLPEPLRRAES